jgi:hypothetical protein
MHIFPIHVGCAVQMHVVKVINVMFTIIVVMDMLEMDIALLANKK